jgi:tRNA pseudouridine13 synthase
MPEFDPWRDLPAAFGGPAGRGRIRARDEDFIVEEQLGFEPTGSGEHLLLRLRETGCNTDWVAGQLARWGRRPRVDVGYAGLKDRHAVTEQWFSVRFPGGRHPDPATLAIEGVEPLAHTLHDRKLRRGALRANRFRLRVTELDADAAVLATRLAAIAGQGVPNAFGPQRFGRDQGNLRAASAWFSGGPPPPRPARGFALSAARALIFNAVLAERLSAGHWQSTWPGDPVQLDARGSWFLAEADDPALQARLAALELHPTGPLWGRGEPPGTGPGVELERAVAARFAVLAQGLAAAGLEHERRALRVRVGELRWQLVGDTLDICFELPAGAFATAVLREFVDVGRG